MRDQIKTMVGNDPSTNASSLTFVELVIARARFVLLLGAVLGIMAFWPLLANYWDKWTRSAPRGGAISSDTEYWCPMCPGVVSDWATKCPVCNMSLVRRKKGEMTPLPDGVVARVQLSPYRVQLGGIRTAPIEYRPLENEIILAGLAMQSSPENKLHSTFQFLAQVNPRDAAVLKLGQSLRVGTESLNGESIPGHILSISPPPGPMGFFSVMIAFENARGHIKKGELVTAKILYPIAFMESIHRKTRERLTEHAALAPLVDPLAGPFVALYEGMVFQVTFQAGLVLSVPESAIIDMGNRKVAYTESMTGIYDAVEVKVGRRSGDYYPVLGGLDYGQRVATNGAVLLDAETRLNPSLAAGYFGAGQRTQLGTATKSVSPNSSLNSNDEILVKKQKICPVTGEPLDSMGGPVRVDLEGRTVFVCCKSCEKPLRKAPAEYLPKLPK